MKTCPVCGATYTSRISFCFEDGAILVASSGVTPDVLPSDAQAGGVSHRVPSRVATPVSPARRGRSLLSGKGSSLSFSPPRAITAPPIAPRTQGPDLSPAPLLPLTIPEDDEEQDLEVYGAPPAPSTEPRAPEEPAAPDRSTPTPAPVARTESTPTPVDHEGPVPPGEDEAASNYVAFDFPEWEPYEDEEEESRRVIPPWLIPVAAVAGVLVIIGGAIVGGTAGLIGSGALHRGEEAEVAVTTPAVEPEPAASATAPAATRPAVPAAVEPPEPATSEPVVEGEEGTTAPDTEQAAEPEPEPEGEASPPVPEEASPSTAPPVSRPPTTSPEPPPTATEPSGTAEPAEGSPWGTLEMRSSTVAITSKPSGAAVFIDGDPIGVTPLEKDVPYGTHAVELRLAGHENATRSVSVENPETPLSFELVAQARSGPVIVVLEGWDGAALYVDGEKVGVLPARIQISEGSHDFKVESPSGTQSVTRDVVLSTSGVTIINLSG